MRPVAIALGLGLVALLLGLVLSLSHAERGLAGTNRVVLGGFTTVLNHRHPTACTRAVVPPNAGALRVVTDTGKSPRPPLAARVGDRRGRVGEGPSGQQIVELKLSGRPRSGAQELCVTSTEKRRVPLGGSPTRDQTVRYVPGGALGPAIRLEWRQETAESGWDRLGSVARHFGWGKSAALRSGTVVLILAGLLMLAALALVVRTVLRAPE